MTLRGGWISRMRATGGVTASLTRTVESVANLFDPLSGRNSFPLVDIQPYYRQVCKYTYIRIMFHVEHNALNIDRRFARLANGRQRVASALFFFDPLLLVAQDVQQKYLIFGTRQVLLAMLFVSAIVERLAGFAMKLLPCPASDVAIEVHVGRVELFFPRLQEGIQAINQA